MPMLTRLRGAVLAVAVAATAVSLGAGPARAANWTVRPGGNVTGTAGTTTIKDTTTGTAVTCASSSLSASLQNGNGMPLGSITSITFNCTGPFGIKLTCIASGSFPINAISYGNGIVNLMITHIHVACASSLCSFIIDGTSATAHNGTENATFTNSNSTLTVLAAGSTLHIYNVSGCFGLIRNGDGAAITGSYVISPRQTITSP